MTKDIREKPYERDEKPQWVKDRISFSLKSYVICRKFKVYTILFFLKPYTFSAFLPYPDFFFCLFFLCLATFSSYSTRNVSGCTRTSVSFSFSFSLANLNTTTSTIM